MKTQHAPNGIWHNEQGSEIVFEAGPGGELRGSFRPGVGLGTDETFPMTGYFADDLVAFVVGFARYGSLTSWVGHRVDDDGPALQTLWQMTLEQPHPGRKDERWKTIWSGADTFRPGPTPAGSRPRRGPTLPLWTR